MAVQVRVAAVCDAELGVVEITPCDLLEHEAEVLTWFVPEETRRQCTWPRDDVRPVPDTEVHLQNTD